MMRSNYACTGSRHDVAGRVLLLVVALHELRGMAGIHRGPVARLEQLSSEEFLLVRCVDLGCIGGVRGSPRPITYLEKLLAEELLLGQ